MRNRFFYISFILVFVLLSTLIVQISMQNVESIPETPRGGDVAVIGGTTAALIAALAASENGAQVHLFPQGQEPGNDTVFLVNEGLAAWGTPPQKSWQKTMEEMEEEAINEQTEEEIELLTRETFNNFFQTRGEGMNDPYLLQHFLDEAPGFYDWMQSFGVNFDYIPQPEYRPFRLQASTPQAGLVFRHKLLEKLEQSCVFIHDETVKSIEMAEDDKHLEALILGNNNGETGRFFIQAVILADGGYSGDLQSWKDYLPHHNILNLRPGQKGRGLKMASELDADVIQVGFLNRRIVLYVPREEQYQLLSREPWENMFLVNRDGQSLDLSQATAAEAFYFIINAPHEGAFIAVPETPEENELSETYFFTRFESWDEAVEAGWLDQAPALQLETPLSIAHVKAGVDYTLGGLSVTPQGEVRRRGGMLKGLFAAGEIAGGLHGEAMLEGMPLSETLFLARSAGKAAAAYARR